MFLLPFWFLSFFFFYCFLADKDSCLYWLLFHLVWSLLWNNKLKKCLFLAQSSKAYFTIACKYNGRGLWQLDTLSGRCKHILLSYHWMKFLYVNFGDSNIFSIVEISLWNLVEFPGILIFIKWIHSRHNIEVLVTITIHHYPN